MCEAEVASIRRTEEECRPLLLSMFRVLKELLIYCEEHSRADLAEDVAEALSMCQTDFTKLKERLNAGVVPDPERGALSRGEASPLAVRTAEPVDEATAMPTSPPHDPLADSPNSNSHMLKQLEMLDMEQLEEAARYFSTTGEVPLMPRKVHEAMQAEWAGKGGLLRLRWPRPSAPALGGSGPLASPSGEGL